jgi:hypothetical protein
MIVGANVRRLIRPKSAQFLKKYETRYLVSYKNWNSQTRSKTPIFVYPRIPRTSANLIR